MSKLLARLAACLVFFAAGATYAVVAHAAPVSIQR